ncbi:unnamed protein product [Heterobilharzia americana]|nr:unnamed protein product [Heterobilharzia americana]
MLMQLFSMNEMWMFVRDFVDTNDSLESQKTKYTDVIVIASCILLAYIIDILLIFVSKLRNSFPANLLLILLAVISFSAGTAIILAKLIWQFATVILSRQL